MTPDAIRVFLEISIHSTVMNVGELFNNRRGKESESVKEGLVRDGSRVKLVSNGNASRL